VGRGYGRTLCETRLRQQLLKRLIRRLSAKARGGRILACCRSSAHVSSEHVPTPALREHAASFAGGDWP